MKLTLTIDVEPKEIRRLVAILSGDLIIDEDIKRNFEDAPHVDASIIEDDNIKKLFIVGYLMAQMKNEHPPKPECTKSKFAQRLEEAQRLQKERAEKAAGKE